MITVVVTTLMAILLPELNDIDVDDNDNDDYDK